MAGEVDPARVGPQFLGVIAGFEEVAARGVQRRHAGIATAGQVDGGQIERQAEQVVAQRAGHEFVDLVADLPRHAADDVAGGDAIGDGVATPLASESNSTGLRKAWMSPIWSLVKVGSSRSIVSVSIEWPKR